MCIVCVFRREISGVFQQDQLLFSRLHDFNAFVGLQEEYRLSFGGFSIGGTTPVEKTALVSFSIFLQL